MNVHATPIAWPALAIFCGGLLLFGAMLLFVGKRAPEDDKGGRSRRSIIGIAIQMLAFFAVGAGPLDLALEPTSPAALAEAAIVLAFGTITCALFFASKRALGRNWSLVARMRSDHELIRTGPYARVRHPIYLGMLLFLLALAVALGHWVQLLVALPVFFIGTAIRTRLEDGLLEQSFGDSFRDYRRSTPALIPRLF